MILRMIAATVKDDENNFSRMIKALKCRSAPWVSYKFLSKELVNLVEHKENQHPISASHYSDNGRRAGVITYTVSQRVHKIKPIKRLQSFS